MSDIIDLLIGWLEDFSYVGIFFLLMLCGLGVPLPEEPILIAGGYVAYQGITRIVPTVMVSMAGILVGDLTAYTLGIFIGKKPAMWNFSRRFVSSRTLVKARRFLRTHGNRTIFIVRFMPGLRMPTYFLAGSMGVKWTVFVGYDFMAALISVPVSVVAAWYFGPHIEYALSLTAHFRHYLFGFLALLVVWWIFLHLHRRKKPARRPPARGAGPRNNKT